MLPLPLRLGAQAGWKAEQAIKWALACLIALLAARNLLDVVSSGKANGLCQLRLMLDYEWLPQCEMCASKAHCIGLGWPFQV